MKIIKALKILEEHPKGLRASDFGKKMWFSEGNEHTPVAAKYLRMLFRKRYVDQVKINNHYVYRINDAGVQLVKDFNLWLKKKYKKRRRIR